MSESPWICDDAAFGPMFRDAAEITVEKTGERGTVMCCVFPREDVDPFAESDAESLAAAASVLVRKRDWVFRERRPSVGDGIRLPNGDVYRVSRVEAEQSWWRLSGRSV